MLAPAPAVPPVTLEAAFADLRARVAKPAEDPISILNRAAAPAEKLAALDALHSSLPFAPQARRTKGLRTLQAVAASRAETAAVRSKALMYLGYAVPVVGDEGARASAVNALLDATRVPADRVYALRGLAPATHDTPESVETAFQTTILGLLAGPLSEEERITALLALDAFVRTRDDLPRRRPDLIVALESAELDPIAANPAGFVARNSTNARLLVVAVVWHSARGRYLAGDQAALTRVDALLAQLAALETDPAVKDEIAAFLAAPAPVAATFQP